MSTDSVLKKVRRPTCFSPSLSLSLFLSRYNAHSPKCTRSLFSPFSSPFSWFLLFCLCLKATYNVYNVYNDNDITYRMLAGFVFSRSMIEIWQSTKINVAFNDRNYRRIKGSRTAFSVTRIDSQVEARYMFLSATIFVLC